jgi:hypothetical protein
MSNEIKQQSINRSDLNTLADTLRAMKFGDILRALPTTLRKSGTEPSPFVASSVRVLTKQSDFAPAAAVFSVFAREGLGIPGQLSQATSYPPATREYAIAPNGKIVTWSDDAWTDLDVIYIPEKGDIAEFDSAVDPSTGILTLPSNIMTIGVVMLLEVTATAGTVTGNKIILSPGAVPGPGNVSMNFDKKWIQFAPADQVTSAHIKLLVASSVDVSAMLDSMSEYV